MKRDGDRWRRDGLRQCPDRPEHTAVHRWQSFPTTGDSFVARDEPWSVDGDQTSIVPDLRP